MFIRFEVVCLVELVVVGDVKVEVDVVGLELLNGIGNVVLLRFVGVVVEGSGVGYYVVDGIRFKNNSKLKIWCGFEFLSKRLDIFGVVMV